MTYPEAIDLLFNSLPVWERARGAAAYKPGLERITDFLTSISDPQNRFPTVHIAGTNGKGSTASMLAAVLQSAGRADGSGQLRVGLFTSPHLVDFRERIRIDGQMISEEAVVEFTEKYRNEMVRLGLTFFEMTTAMALWWFSGRNVGGCTSDHLSTCSASRQRTPEGGGGCAEKHLPVDIAIIEAGLGGRLDSTNVITPLVSIITNIGLEHTDYLGDTIAAIAAEKAGIIKRGVPVVIGETDPESSPVFRAKAAETGSEIVFADNQGFLKPVRTPPLPRGGRNKVSPLLGAVPGDGFDLGLQGAHQLKNAATVLAAVDVLRRGGLRISDEAVRHGLTHTAVLTGLRGRWEVIDTGRPPTGAAGPLVVCDTAHNAHGFSEIARQIEHQMDELRAFDPHLFMILGFAADKDLAAIAEFLPPDAYYILTQADTPRAMSAEELRDRLKNHFTNRSENLRSEIITPVAKAYERARELAGAGDLIYVGGSNFVVGELLKTV